MLFSYSFSHDLQVVYTAKGVNRSWEWLSMVLVSIFALCEVMQNVQKEFATPFNSISHTTSSTSTDVTVLRNYLQDQRIQTHWLKCINNDDSMEAQDLIQAGAEYANTPSAFCNFTYPRYNTKNHGLNSDSVANSIAEDKDGDEDQPDEDNSIDPGNCQTDFDDLLLDEDEYPTRVDGTVYCEMMLEMVNELGGLCTYICLFYLHII